MATDVQDIIRIKGHTQKQLAITTTAAQITTLVSGYYDVWAEGVDIYIQHTAQSGDATSGLTTSTGYRIAKYSWVTLFIDPGDKIGGIAAGITTLHFHRIA